jgi:hypothetical protein
VPPRHQKQQEHQQEHQQNEQADNEQQAHQVLGGDEGQEVLPNIGPSGPPSIAPAHAPAQVARHATPEAATEGGCVQGAAVDQEALVQPAGPHQVDGSSQIAAGGSVPHRGTEVGPAAKRQRFMLSFSDDDE